MRPLFALLVCLVAMPCSAAGYDWMVAQAAPPAVSAAAECSCGPDCPCSKEALEKYQTYKLYHDRMEEWLKSQGLRQTAATPIGSNVVPASNLTTIVTRQPITYSQAYYSDDDSACANGQCALPSQTYQTRPSYTNGRYSNWTRSGLFRGGRFFGGSCANGQCGQ